MKKKFDIFKTKYLKKIGVALIIIIICLYGIFNIKIQSVHQYENWQASNSTESQNETVTLPESTESITEIQASENSKEQDETVLQGLSSSETKQVNVQKDSTYQSITQTESGFDRQEDEQSSEIVSFNENTDNAKKNTIICSLEIRCNTLADDLTQWTNKHKDPYQIVPDDGVILPVTKVTVDENSTAFDVLMKIVGESAGNLKVDESKSYIRGINELYEKDAGSMSGWMYFVNSTDKYINKSIATYPVKDGDKIILLYTCDGGKDLQDKD